ncbi:MAG: ATP-binding cassette domain-containing protein [Proteobacteria bacterium]|nr:ATP-binding cassette domain-containing protein [Pseudomonadota bacterium]
MIKVERLNKIYQVPLKDPGFWGSLKSVFSREYRQVHAVNEISFTIEPGERVGFLGPNGAGKTTTLKMLTGLLYPTSGTCEVAGFRPQDRHVAFLKDITLVMGQKQQLLWDLPATETFLLNRALFDIPHSQYAETLTELTELLDLADFADQPVRNLSLGQRMRCELAAALLHRPKVLFLDEPTIGLDVQVQAQVRRFIAEYNQRYGATVMLTSHDMNDVAALCRRIILIDQGVVRFDGSLEDLSRTFGTGRQVSVRGPRDLLEKMGFAQDDDRMVRLVPRQEVNELLGEVLRQIPSAEVTVADPPLEEVLRRAFSAEGEE